MKDRKINIYLAGKVEGDKWKLVEDLEKDSRFKFLASDGGNHSEHNYGVCQFDFKECNPHGVLNNIVQEEFNSKIARCDFLLAYLDCNTSYGSIAEIAWASAKGIPCHIILKRGPYAHHEDDDFFPMDEDGRFDAYWFVSCFPKVTNVEVESLAEAKIESLNTFLRWWCSIYSNSFKFMQDDIPF
jgi:nucleoside 2-deoxyribosyltransferase